MTSRLAVTARIVSLMPSSVSESSDEVASSKIEQLRPAQQRAGDGEPLLLAARHLDAALADDGVESLLRARQQTVAGRLVQHLEALRVGGGGTHEQQIFADRSGKQLRVLRDEPDALAQPIEIDVRARLSVVENPARLRRVQPDQQLDQRRLARARGPDERDRLTAR